MPVPQEKNMDVEKLRNLTDAELLHQQRELNDQLFRMKFQLKMGQTESLNKIRGLRKDVARIHTVIREKELGIVPQASAKTQAGTEAAPAESAAPAAPKKQARAGKSAKAKTAKGKTAKKKAATAKARKK
jgi:large subunit ribosomal protein L29